MSRREQVVVVGAGMVGHRFVEELVARDREHRFDVHLVGAEEYEPYNRILLTEVLARRCDVATLTLPRPPDRAVVRRGVSATAIDRDARTVHLDDGTVLDYDHLVLATGATAFVPPRGSPTRAEMRPVTCTSCAPLTTAATSSPAPSTQGTPSCSAAACSVSRRRAGSPVEVSPSPSYTSRST